MGEPINTLTLNRQWFLESLQRQDEILIPQFWGPEIRNCPQSQNNNLNDRMSIS